METVADQQLDAPELSRAAQAALDRLMDDPPQCPDCKVQMDFESADETHAYFLCPNEVKAAAKVSWMKPVLRPFPLRPE